MDIAYDLLIVTNSLNICYIYKRKCLECVSVLYVCRSINGHVDDGPGCATEWYYNGPTNHTQTSTQLTD